MDEDFSPTDSSPALTCFARQKNANLVACVASVSARVPSSIPFALVPTFAQ